MGINRYENGAWAEINDLKAFRDGAWQAAELRRYDGAQWEQLWPCHFICTTSYALESYVVTEGMDAPEQISSDYLITGSSNGDASVYIHDSLLFFPMEQMTADLAGAQILEASLQLKRKAKHVNEGGDTAYLMIGCALSRVKPSRKDNTWEREYTELLSSSVGFGFDQKKSVPFDTKGIIALMNGTADCLCLPTIIRYTYNTAGYGYYEPEQTILTVTYYK